MNRNRRLKQGVAGRDEAKLGRLVLVSLGLHLLVFGIFSGLILPRFQRPRPPVYFVDLVNLPVARPQAGRPEARPQPVRKHRPKAEPAPRPAPPKPKPRPKVAAPLKTTPPAPKRAPAKIAPKPPAASYEKDTLSAIDKIRRRRELEELKAKLARLEADNPRPDAAAPAAPVGMPEGKGDQAGVEQRAWLQAFYKANWRLSRYQVTNPDLEARVRVRYDSEGNLVDYQMQKPSGDQAFDDSVKRAILLDKKLPFTPGHPLEEEVVFNLKDLME